MSEDAGRAGERICRGCGERLRPGARPEAEFCSSVCRSRQWRRERRLRKRLAAVQGGTGEVFMDRQRTPATVGVLLADVREHLETLEEARTKPHVLAARWWGR